jgi:hypothetical protein
VTFAKLTARERAEAARLGIITDPDALRDLPGYGACTDPDTLRAAAAIELAAERRAGLADVEGQADDDGPAAA